MSVVFSNQLPNFFHFYSSLACSFQKSPIAYDNIGKFVNMPNIYKSKEKKKSDRERKPKKKKTKIEMWLMWRSTPLNLFRSLLVIFSRSLVLIDLIRTCFSFNLLSVLWGSLWPINRANMSIQTQASDKHCGRNFKCEISKIILRTINFYWCFCVPHRIDLNERFKESLSSAHIKINKREEKKQQRRRSDERTY